MAHPGEQHLIHRIRQGDEVAWKRLIEEYEGRLLAFVVSRLKDRSQAEDLVQETFLGFLASLPNYDENASLEAFLFAIAANKLTDTLRRQGRRPLLHTPQTWDNNGENHGPLSVPDRRARGASSLARSHELRHQEEEVIAAALRDLIAKWKSNGEWERLMCAELLLVRGLSNKATAARLGVSEQAVANHKQFIVGKLKQMAATAPGLEAAVVRFESPEAESDRP